jgi:hypothetical protein
MEHTKMYYEFKLQMNWCMSGGQFAEWSNDNHLTA